MNVSGDTIVLTVLPHIFLIAALMMAGIALARERSVACAVGGTAMTVVAASEIRRLWRQTLGAAKRETR
jgi:hypothetical protein